MVELYKALERLRMDNRMVENQIRSGNLSEAELKKHLDSLPDLSAQCIRIEFEDDFTGNGADHHQ